MNQPDQRLHDTLTGAITGHRTLRIPLETIRSWALDGDPTLNGDPTARDRIRHTLDRLVDDGLITYPSATNRDAWDRKATPPLPAWINRVNTRTAPPTPRPVTRVWPHTLETAGALATRPDEIALLEAIARWLRDNPHPIHVPIEERSLQLLGDEKALGKLVNTRLFTTPGTLTLDLLACHHTPLPLASTYIPGNGTPTLLVVENNATYFSFITATRALPDDQRPNLHIAWGHGGQVVASIASATVLDPAPAAIRYLGDLDPAGLRIPVNANTTARNTGLAEVQPATHLYQWLLDHGTPQPAKPDVPRTIPDAVRDWLPPELRVPISHLIASGHRVAQETVGLEALLAEPELIAVLGG